MDRKQSAVARRLAEAKTTPLFLAQQAELQAIEIQVGKHENTLTSFNGLFIYIQEKVQKNQDNISSIFVRLADVEAKVSTLPKSLTLDELNFNLTPASTTMAQGRLLWDSEYSTLLLGLNANINLALGQAMYKKIRNNTGVTIIKGQVVYVTGSHGASNITVGLADASSEATAATTMGIAAENIGINSEGFIITQGYLKGINTNSLAGAEGSMLWLSETSGEITTTRPTQPAHGVHVGWLVKKAGGGAGSIYVHITNGQELYELHDVLISSPQDGQVLTYDNISGLWKNEYPNGAIVPNSVNTSIDFGTNPNETTTETIVTGQLWVTAGSNIQIRCNPTQSHGHFMLDYLLENIVCMVTKVNPNSGFVIKAYAPNGTFGIYDIIAYEV
jgi:uncharacterized coiled-coil protein SlyX